MQDHPDDPYCLETTVIRTIHASIFTSSSGVTGATEQVDYRIRFVSRLYRMLEEQRIDIVFTAHQQQDPRPVVEAAKRTGILLAQV